MNDRIHCVACGGTGKAPLGAELQETLNVCRDLARHNEHVTSNAVRRRLASGVAASTMCNRLTALARAGFLVRDAKHGRERAFRVVPTQDTRPRFVERRGTRGRVLYGGPPAEDIT